MPPDDPLDPARLTYQQSAALTNTAIEREANNHATLVNTQLQNIATRIDGVENTATALRDGTNATINARLDAMDKATIVLNETVTRVPTQLQSAVREINELQDVKFAAIASRFDLLDKQTAREKAAADLAVQAAFAAADKAAAAATGALTEAIAKSEKNTAETIKQISEVTRTGDQALNDKVLSANDRMTRLEALIIALQSERSGGRDTRDSARQNSTLAIAAAGFVIALIVAVVTVIATRSNGTTVDTTPNAVTEVTTTITLTH